MNVEPYNYYYNLSTTEYTKIPCGYARLESPVKQVNPVGLLFLLYGPRRSRGVGI